MTVAVMKVAAKRLTNVEVEKFTIIVTYRSSIEVKRMSAVLALALMVLTGTTVLLSSFGTTEMSRQLTTSLLLVTESDGWAVTIVDEGSFSRRRDQYGPLMLVTEYSVCTCTRRRIVNLILRNVPFHATCSLPGDCSDIIDDRPKIRLRILHQYRLEYSC